MLKALQDILPNSFVTTTLSTAPEITGTLAQTGGHSNQCSVYTTYRLCMLSYVKITSVIPRQCLNGKCLADTSHAITAHSPLLYRIITPRLLNTEVEERVFGQCKAITRSTSESNQHTSNIITNLLVRMHYEQKRSETNPLQEQESEVFKLVKTLPAKIDGKFIIRPILKELVTICFMAPVYGGNMCIMVWNSLMQ